MKRNTKQNLKLALFLVIVLGVPVFSVFFFGIFNTVAGILALMLIMIFINIVFAKNQKNQ